MLLDLNIPKIDGISVLKHIREDDRLRCLPVVIFTTSKLEADRIRSYNLHINAYIRKPVGFRRFAETLRIINLFWELVEYQSGRMAHAEFFTPLRILLVEDSEHDAVAFHRAFRKFSTV